MHRSFLRLAAVPLLSVLVVPATAASPALADGPVVVVTAVVRQGDGGLRFLSRPAASRLAGERLADRWQDQAGVVAAAVDTRVRALAVDTYRPEQWGLDRLEAELQWPAGDGAGTVVAVVDTGVDGAHVDLAGQVLAPVDVVEPSATRTVGIDPNGHGTHVAGTIAALTGNGKGVAGLAPGARILPVRVLDADGGGYSGDVAEGIVRAVDAGADILNLSLGGPERSAVLEAAVAYAVERDVVLVAAAGNSGAGGPVEYPAGLPGVLGVAATTPVDALTEFSTTGPHVDLAAPGRQILSTYPEDRLAELSGTSMAAPFVSAAAALVMSSGTPRSRIGELLVASAEDLGPAGRDDGFGAGLVDITAARQSSATGPSTTPSPTPDPSPSPVPVSTPSPSPVSDPSPSPAPPSMSDPSPSPSPAPVSTPTPTPQASTPSPAAPAETPNPAPSTPANGPAAQPQAPAPTHEPTPASNPAPAPTPAPTAEPTPTPQPTTQRTPEPTSNPTPQPTPQRAPESTSNPTPTPAPGPGTSPTTSPVPTPAPSSSASPVPGVRVSVSTRAVTFGQPVIVAARALRGGTGVGGVRVTLERSTGAGWVNVRTGTSGPDGTLSWTLRPDRGGSHRARVAGAVSGAARVDVRPRITVSARVAAVTGRVAPGGRVTVLLERRTRAGWVRHQSTATTTGAYRFVPRLPRTTALRIVVPARPGLLAAVGRPFKMT